MKKQNPEIVPLSDATGHVELPPIPALRTFVVRTSFGERVVGAHDMVIDSNGVVGLFVLVNSGNNQYQIPRLVVSGEYEIEEINLAFPELMDEGH